MTIYVEKICSCAFNLHCVGESTLPAAFTVSVFLNLSNKHDLNSVFSAELMCSPCSPHHHLFYLNVQDVLVDVSIICSVRLRLIFNLHLAPYETFHLITSLNSAVHVRMTFFNST